MHDLGFNLGFDLGLDLSCHFLLLDLDLRLLKCKKLLMTVKQKERRARITNFGSCFFTRCVKQENGWDIQSNSGINIKG